MMSRAKLLCLTFAGIVILSSLVAPVAKATRVSVPPRDALVLDGASCGSVRSVEGGAISAEVIGEPTTTSPFIKKHIGQPKYETFAVQVGFGMARPVYDWIRQSWATGNVRKNGSLVTVSSDMQVQSERQFLNALIAETIIPTLDAASKDPVYITVKLAPEGIRSQRSDVKIGTTADEQRVVLGSGFQLKIDGLDCSRVSRIESFTVKQTPVTESIGEIRDYTKQPGKLDFPNLKINMPEASARSFVDWHNSFVVQGNNDDSFEKSGVLTLLAGALDRPMPAANIKFFNMGIVRVQLDKLGSDGIRRVTVEMYVERMEFECPAATSALAPAPAPTPTASTTLSTVTRG